MVTRPLELTTRTGLATATLLVEVAGAVTVANGAVDVGATLVAAVRFVVPAVRVELVAAIVEEPETLAGGLRTAAAVGDSVRTLANVLGAVMELLVGVTAVPDGAITGAALFVTAVVVVVEVVADGRKTVSAGSVGTGGSGSLTSAPLRIASVGAE
jgi:hypothetical protein